MDSWQLSAARSIWTTLERIEEARNDAMARLVSMRAEEQGHTRLVYDGESLRDAGERAAVGQIALIINQHYRAHEHELVAKLTREILDGRR